MNDFGTIYNPEGSTLRMIQLRMLDILKCVDAICRKYDIKYWLSSGTLLGAVRHGGFIPWDDDLDIEMLRGDYLKLLRILPSELPQQYVLQSYKNDFNYIYLFCKVRDLNSEIVERCGVNRGLKYNGVFIDLFPLEPSFDILAKFSAVLFDRCCFNLASTNKKVLNKLCKLNLFILLNSVFPFFRVISRFSNSEKIGHTFGVNFLKKRSLDDIFPLKQIMFEGHLFYAPCNYDSYLKKLYGDYMKIPDSKDVHVMDGRIKIW